MSVYVRECFDGLFVYVYSSFIYGNITVYDNMALFVW